MPENPILHVRETAARYDAERMARPSLLRSFIAIADQVEPLLHASQAALDALRKYHYWESREVADRLEQVLRALQSEQVAQESDEPAALRQQVIELTAERNAWKRRALELETIAQDLL